MRGVKAGLGSTLGGLSWLPNFTSFPIPLILTHFHNPVKEQEKLKHFPRLDMNLNKELAGV